MATNEQAIEKLIEAVRLLHLALVQLDKPKTFGVLKEAEEIIYALSNAIASRDSSAGTAEIELCPTCKQRPCGCGKAAKPCEHESKYVVSGYVSQNDVTCVICSACSTVGKRFDGGPIEWWPSPTPAVPDDPVPPWPEMFNNRKCWESDMRNHGMHATLHYVEALERQRDALRSRQNEVAKEILKELWNTKDTTRDGCMCCDRWKDAINAKLASLGGA